MHTRPKHQRESESSAWSVQYFWGSTDDCWPCDFVSHAGEASLQGVNFVWWRCGSLGRCSFQPKWDGILFFLVSNKMFSICHCESWVLRRWMTELIIKWRMYWCLQDMASAFRGSDWPQWAGHLFCHRLLYLNLMPDYRGLKLMILSLILKSRNISTRFLSSFSQRPVSKQCDIYFTYLLQKQFCRNSFHFIVLQLLCVIHICSLHWAIKKIHCI